jgi:hypothetical protein
MWPAFARRLSYGLGRVCVGNSHRVSAVRTVAGSAGELVVEFDRMATVLA